MEVKKELDVSIIPYEQCAVGTTFDLDQIIYDLDSQIELLSSQADTLDYLVAVASGILCGMLDVLWVGEFNLERGREIASDKVESFVKKAAKLTGCESDDLGAAVKHLEKLFPIPSDGNTPDFGGGLQHHLRDFAHHPTIVGLMFSLLTQFTYKSYGTNTAGAFIIVDVPEKSRPFIGEDVPTKILYGTLTWFFHLVSDMAGSSSTAGKTGGTGIPGPLLALAKELSVLPFFRDLQVGEHGISLFLSKLFNGTLLAQHDENGQIIKDTVLKMDLRGELGIAAEPQESGESPEENARIKAAFYGKFCGRVICNDSGLYFDSIPMDDPRQPGLNIRTPQGRRLDDEEMIEYYSALVHKLGGKTLDYYLDGIAVYRDGEIESYLDEQGKAAAFYMVETPSPNRHPGWPLDSLSVNKNTMTYFVDHGNNIYDCVEEQIMVGEYRQRVVDCLKRALGI